MTHDTRHTQLHAIYHYLRVVAASLVLCLTIQSCDKQSHPLTPEEDVAISMTVSSAEMDASRAIVTDNATLQSTAIGVYAYKELANGTQPMVFDNTQLTYDANKGWDYSPTKYWDRTAYYSFVAFSPYTATHSYENHTLTISDIPYWQVINGNEVDYLVANSHGSAESYLLTDSKSVPLAFSHILSQLVINVVKDANLTNTEYKVKTIEYINVPASGGKAEYTYSSSPSFSDISITSSVSSPSSVPMLEQEKVVTLANANDIISLPHLVVPFTLTDDKQVQVKVTYTVAGTERNKTVDTGITQLEAGKRYELTLTFKGAEIVPELEVKNWIEQPVDEDPKYNW